MISKDIYESLGDKAYSELKKKSKYSILNNIEVIYSFVKNVTPTTKPGLVRVKNCLTILV